MEFRKGLQLPKLTKYIKGILQQYPDDGQILKELLQNADDAGASIVRFVLDESQYPAEPDDLVHPDLHHLQGPALLAFNDAVFSEDDWNGICLMEESIKRDDIIKTGRFGLGFKSIFHVTDLPMILSGDYVGMIDPHQAYLPEKRSAYNWHLTNDQEYLHTKLAQFEPLCQALFNVEPELLENGAPYKHTVFRFPLRNTSSVLSSTCYTAEKVRQLFRSLEVDQGQSLLFLKSIQSIEIYIKSDQTSVPHMMCRMKVADTSAKEVSEKREQFQEKVLQQAYKDHPFESITTLTIEMERTANNNTSVRKQDWIVYNTCLADKEVLHVANDLKVLPWVGIALPKSKVGFPDQAGGAGQLFATLPLPLDGTERTGFSFHIHSYFAMEQNRRHLRWPTPEQENSSSSQLRWNQLLVNKCIPNAITTFFVRCLDLEKSDQMISPETIYQLLPNKDMIDTKWKPTVHRIYDEMLTQPCLYSPSSGGRWVRPKDSILLDIDQNPELNSYLEEILADASFAVVNPPMHLRTKLENSNWAKPSTVSCSLVRNAFLQNSKSPNVDLDRHRILLLLQFFLECGQLKDLIGLPFIPLLSKSFGVFQKAITGGQPIFIATESHPASLLPGLDDLMVDTAISATLRTSLLKLAQSGHTQLKSLNFKLVMQTIPLVLPQSWVGQSVVEWTPESDPTQPTALWMEQIWDYIHRNNPRGKDWLLLDKLHLLPLNMGKQLCQFSHGNKIVIQEKGTSSLPLPLCQFLTEVGVYVLMDLPEFVQRSIEIVYHFVCPPTCDGILDSMVTINQSKGAVFFDTIRGLGFSENSFLLLEFVGYLSDSGINMLSKNKKKFLRKLPLFSTVDGSQFQKSKVVTLEEVNLSSPTVTIPVPMPLFVIHLYDDKVRHLIDSLDIKKYHQFSFPQILTDALFPAIRNYSQSQLDDLVCFIMDNHQNLILNNEKIANQIKALNFVETQNGNHSLPTQIYDPRDPLLKDFLAEKHKPHKKYLKKNRLICLEKLGMKAAAEVEEELFIEVAKSISTQPDMAAQFIELTKLLDATTPAKMWWEKLRDIRFLPSVFARPEGYPGTMPWKGSRGVVYLPSEVYHISKAKQAGGFVPVVDLDCSILSRLTNRGETGLRDLVLQLKFVTENYCVNDKSRYLLLLDEVYSNLTRFTKKEIKTAFAEQSIVSWIWSGDGFQTPGRIMLRKVKRDLSPYVFSLPAEMESHKELFHKFGAQETIPFTKVLKAIVTRYNENDKMDPEDVSRDLHLYVDILKKLTLEGETGLLVPVESDSSTTLRFMLPSDCTVWDGTGEKEGLHIVNEAVVKEVITRLEIPTMVNRLGSEELDMGIESYGQTEPLTTRLKSILEGYTDGLAILKEMVQNADDAGATQVRLVYDQRENSGHRQSLLDPGLASWQGPALWIYNDSVFSEHDFENIVRLNAGTKMDKDACIGAFGLGFNAVYNITDVPSVLSKDTYIIFDPHTTYLGNALRNKERPGLRISIAKSKGRLLKQYPDQFAPWNGVLGCNLTRQANDTTFDGTLFRLPLRGIKESYLSDICNMAYNEKNVHELLQMIYHKGNNMLLFTQNVLKVTVSVIPKGGSATDMQDLFEIRKEPVRYLRQHGVDIVLSETSQKTNEDGQKFISECSILKACAVNRQNGDTVPLQSSMIISSVVETFNGIEIYLNEGKRMRTKETHWLLSQCVQGDPRSADLNLSQAPIAGVAIPLGQDGEKYHLMNPTKAMGTDTGAYYSFLPLPVRCSLPFHVNGCFILDPSRRHLAKKTDHDKTSPGGTWNRILMESAVCTAYMKALEDVITLVPHTENITSLFPVNKEDDLTAFLSVSFWRKITMRKSNAAIFWGEQGRANLQHSCFLDSTAFTDLGPDVRKAVKKLISEVFAHRKLKLAYLPYNIEKTLEIIDASMLKSKTVTEERFFIECFIPDVSKVSPNIRDQLLLRALKTPSQAVFRALGSHACIPVSPSGEKILHPHKLIHPDGYVACLYDDSDSRFPLIEGIASENDPVYDILTKLGMVNWDLKWEDIIDRAFCIVSVGPEKELKFVNDFLDYLQTKVAHEKGKVPVDVQQQLRNIPFLPAAPKPRDWTISWAGSDPSYCGLKLSKVKEPLLLGTQMPVLHSNTKMSNDLAQILGINVEAINLQCLRQQLAEICANKENMKSASVSKSYDVICSYLDRECHDEFKASKIAQTFSGMPFIHINGYFVKPSMCAHTVNFNSQPYLNEVSKMQYPKLMKALKVKPEFDATDYIDAIARMKYDFPNQPVPTYICKMIAGLCKWLVFHKQNIKSLNWNTPLYVPDRKGILKLADDLCYNGSSWLNLNHDYPLISPSVDVHHAKVLGMTEVRTKVLSELACPIQSETQKYEIPDIRSALEVHPPGVGMLHEIMRAAENAESESVHFLLDPRTYKKEMVFSDGWKAVQGPSLVVSIAADISNIDCEVLLLSPNKAKDQRLRLSEDTAGFLGVYHLTDTPIVLSPSRKSIAIYDPQGKTIPPGSASAIGTVYKNTEKLRTLFPDVFHCFYQDWMGSGTTFRFPLRTSEGAASSEISNTSMSYQRVDDILSSFAKEAHELLLFTKCLKKVQISRLNIYTGVINTQTIAATVSEESQNVFDEFKKHLAREKIKQLKYWPGNNPEFKQVSYELTLKDEHKEEVWQVVQQCGLEQHKKAVPMKYGLYQAFSKNETNYPTFEKTPEIALAGVAFKKTGQSTTGKFHRLMPLSQTTSLPVHVNTHLILTAVDQEALSMTDEVKYQWNSHMNQVLVEAYGKLIRTMKQTSIVNDTQDLDHETIKQYFQAFPQNDEDMNNIDAKIVPDLYCALAKESIIPENSSHSPDIQWKRPEDVIFTNKEMQVVKIPRFEEALKGAHLCGFPKSKCPGKIHNLLEKHGKVTIRTFSPQILLEFLPRSNTEELAQLVAEDKNHKARPGLRQVKKMLKFCQCYENFAKSLSKLPLMVTTDGELGVFDTMNPVYKTKLIEPLHVQSKSFLHTELVSVLADISSCVFKELDIQGYCEALEQYLPKKFKKGEVIDLEEVVWQLSKIQVRRIWNTLDEIRDATPANLVKVAGDLSILPVVEYRKVKMYPVKDAHQVFKQTLLGYHFDEFMIPSWCGFPMLDQLESKSALEMIASPDRPEAILHALHHYRTETYPRSSIFQQPNIMKYFNKHHLQLSQADMELIKELPIFEMLSSKYTSLTGQHAFVIPGQVPMEDMDSWKNPVPGTLFLKQKPDYKNFYERLGCKYYEEPDLYIEYIFPQLEFLTDKGLSTHLTYVFKNLNKDVEVMEALGKVECVKNKGGDQCRPSDLYDPTVALFRKMHPESLPLDEFCNDFMLEVLEDAGMQTTVTEEMLITYAKQISLTSNAICANSDDILEYLQEQDDEDLPEYMEALAEIPFVEQRESPLKCVCPGKTENTLVTLKDSAPEELGELVWSVCTLISDSWLELDSDALLSAGVMLTPSTRLVAQNIRRVCEHATDMDLVYPERKLLNQVLTRCYRYIAEGLEAEDYMPESLHALRDILQDSCCVPVDDARQFVKPSQVVVQTTESYQVKPYLWILPNQVEKAEQLLLNLGAWQKPTAEMYQVVLELIFAKCGRRTIVDNTDLQAAEAATNHVFKRVMHDDALNIHKDLWLLSSDNCLWPASDLIISNSQAIKNRLMPGTKLLADLSSIRSPEIYSNKFPEEHRPKLLTAEVKEVVAHTTGIFKGTCELMERLTSTNSIENIKRLGYHILSNDPGTGQDEMEGTLAAIETGVQKIKIRMVDKLQTCLTNNSASVVGKAQDKRVFADRTSGTFYVLRSIVDCGRGGVYMYKALAELINELCVGIFKSHISVLMVIVSEEEADVSKILDEMDIVRFEQ